MLITGFVIATSSYPSRWKRHCSRCYVVDQKDREMPSGQASQKGIEASCVVAVDVVVIVIVNEESRERHREPVVARFL